MAPHSFQTPPNDLRKFGGEILEALTSRVAETARSVIQRRVNAVDPEDQAPGATQTVFGGDEIFAKRRTESHATTRGTTGHIELFCTTMTAPSTP